MMKMMENLNISWRKDKHHQWIWVCYEGVVAITGKDPLVQGAERAPSSSGSRVSADNRQELSQVVTEANLKVMLISIMLAEVKEISTDPAHQNLDSGEAPKAVRAAQGYSREVQSSMFTPSNIQ